MRRAVARVDAKKQRAWAEGRLEIPPAARKKRTPHSGSKRPQRPSEAVQQPPRLSFLAEPSRADEPEQQPPAIEHLARPVPPPAQMRREQARIRRAALIAQQLGERDLPFYFVDFMNVEDLSRQLGFEKAVADIAKRESRDPSELTEAWHEAVARIAEDEQVRYVDALRPYIDRIEAELES
jgi:hypothetical protein